MRITNEVADATEYGGRELASGRHSTHILWDQVDGFGLRIYPSGRKVWILKYRTRYGKQRWYTIGTYPDLSSTVARREAERLRSMIAMGGDPRAERVEERSGFTIADLADEYLEKYAKQRKKSWRADERRIERHVVPAWGRLHPDEVTRPRVAELHRSIASASGKVEANRTLALVSKIFAWAIRHEFVSGANPATGVEKYRERPKTRWIQRDEMPFVLDALDAELGEHGQSGDDVESLEGRFVVAFFRLVLLTGARRSEMLGLQWRDVSIERKTITFRDTKNGEDHTIPLSTAALDELRDLPRVDGNPHVFVGRVEGAPLRSVQKAWQRIRARACDLARDAGVDVDVSDVTIHDLRRTCGAWLATAGYSELLIARVLNHSIRSVTSIYARVADDAIRDALEAYARQLENVRRADAGKVIELRR